MPAPPSPAVLTDPVLVVNRSLQPLTVVCVARAFTLLFAGKAEAVNHTDPTCYERYTWADWKRLRPVSGDRIVRTVQGGVVVPQAICLRDYDALPRRKVTCNRANIYKRDHYTCQFCGKQPGTAELTLDHVLPRSQGGTMCWENIVACCVECNKKKADRTPAQANMQLRKPPQRPAWRPLYAMPVKRFRSWNKFVDEMYWRVPLAEG